VRFCFWLEREIYTAVMTVQLWVATWGIDNNCKRRGCFLKLTIFFLIVFFFFECCVFHYDIFKNTKFTILI